MAEKVVIRMNSEFRTEIWAPDPHEPESDEIHQVVHINGLTPYGMLMSSLGACTAVLLHTYAQHHKINLKEVELVIQYQRVFAEDCENCEEIDEYNELIEQEIVFTGELSAVQREKLFSISRHCPVHKMLKQGIEVKSKLIRELD